MNPEYESTQQDLTEIKMRKLRNAGSGIQGMALAIIKVLLLKSTLTKFFVSKFKISYDHIQSWHDPYWDHETSYPTLSHTLLSFQLLITTMMNSELSLHNRGATMIWTDYNPAGNSRPHNICRSLTYIYQPTLGSSKTRMGPHDPRIQYSTNPAHCHVGTRYSRHLSTLSARVAILVIE